MHILNAPNYTSTFRLRCQEHKSVLVTDINNSDESGLEGIRKPGVAVKQATRNIIQCSIIKQIHSRQPELALNTLVIYRDQPDSALKYAVVRLVIRNDQTLKIQPLFFFFFKLKKTKLLKESL